jgi:hypothetical protein
VLEEMGMRLGLLLGIAPLLTRLGPSIMSYIRHDQSHILRSLTVEKPRAHLVALMAAQVPRPQGMALNLLCRFLSGLFFQASSPENVA